MIIVHIEKNQVLFWLRRLQRHRRCPSKSPESEGHSASSNHTQRQPDCFGLLPSFFPRLRHCFGFLALVLCCLPHHQNLNFLSCLSCLSFLQIHRCLTSQGRLPECRPSESPQSDSHSPRSLHTQRQPDCFRLLLSLFSRCFLALVLG